MKAVFSYLVIASALLVPFQVFSQVPTPSPASPNKDDVVRISTNLIQIDATVVDKKGNIVRDLSPEDFEIFENGSKQKITHFSFIENAKTGDTTSKNSEPTKNSKQDEADKVPLPVKLKPEQVRRTIALVVDDLGLSFGAINQVRDSLKKFVDTQMQFGDLVAIIRTGAGAGFLQQFTSDKRVLYAAIDKVRWNTAGSGKISIFQPMDPSDIARPAPGSDPVLSLDADAKAMADAAQAKAMATESLRADDLMRDQLSDFRDDVFTVGSLGAINYVVEGMSKLGGRKALVLFSEGFKMYSQDRYQKENGIKPPSTRLVSALQHLTESANRNGVIIYPIDARGIVNPVLIGADDSFENLDPNSQTWSEAEKLSINRSTELMETQQGLRALAEATGGVAFVNNNNFNLSIEKALNDQGGYYLLGYVPNEETFDPAKVRFNKLNVSVKRPDLKVRYRSGFYGIKDDDSAPKLKTAREQIYGAIASPLNATEFKIQLASVFANDPKQGNFIRTMIWVDGGSLTFTDDGKGWQTAKYDVVALLFGDKDTVVDEVSRKQSIRATAETLKEIKEKGFVATILVPIKKAGAYQMRVVVRDDPTSKIGSASEFIQVPNIKKDQLYISGLLLQRAEDPDPSVSKQFQSDGVRDLAERTFAPGMKLRLGFGIYNAKLDAGSKQPDLSIRYRIFRDANLVYSSAEKKVTTLDSSDPKRLIAEDEFKLSDAIRPGSYIIQLIVRDGYGKEKSGVTYQFIDFDVKSPFQ